MSGYKPFKKGRFLPRPAADTTNAGQQEGLSSGVE